MNNLLVLFAFPVATIILAIVLEKILSNPLLTAANFFAIFLVITFAFFDETFLVFAIVYTILAFITAFIAEIIFDRCRCRNRWIEQCNNENNSNNNNSNNNNNNNNNHNSNNNNANQENENDCGCRRKNETLTANITNNLTGRRSSWCCYRR